MKTPRTKISPATSAGRLDGILSVERGKAYSDYFIGRVAIRELAEEDRAEYRKAFEAAARTEGTARFAR